MNLFVTDYDQQAYLKWCLVVTCVFLALLHIVFIMNLKAVFKCFSYRKLENGAEKKEILIN